jgi:hypothetical protein
MMNAERDSAEVAFGIHHSALSPAELSRGENFNKNRLFCYFRPAWHAVRCQDTDLTAFAKAMAVGSSHHDV